MELAVSAWHAAACWKLASSVKPNLLPAEMDIDLGEESGFQFQQSAGQPLDVKVHVRPKSGYYMTSFMVKIGDFDTSMLTSAYSDGASWTDAITYSGIAEQFNDPASEVVLAASNPSSTQQTKVTVGTVRLGVVGSGVTLITGVIQSMLLRTTDYSMVHQEIQDVPIVLQQLGKKLKEGQVYESNSVSLKLALNRIGVKKVKTYRVEDDLRSTTKAVEKCLEKSDLVLISGGISVGDYDFVKQALENNKVKEVFYKVNQRPGKPLWFGQKGNTRVYALPGNPAS